MLHFEQQIDMVGTHPRDSPTSKCKPRRILQVLKIFPCMIRGPVNFGSLPGSNLLRVSHHRTLLNLSLLHSEQRDIMALFLFAQYAHLKWLLTR